MMTYTIRNISFYMPEEELQELYIGNHNNNWVNNAQEKSILDENLFHNLYKDESAGLEIIEGER